ncbi:uncharacterized protein T551_03729, partial [Pneumocystis jirovecii RU7]
HSLARAVARAVKRRAAAQNDEVEEEYVLALLLKNDGLEGSKCKEKLKEYCGNLKKVDEDFSIYPKLKEICKDDDAKKCTGLKAKVVIKQTSFKEKLDKASAKQISQLKDEDCLNQKECLFLEGAFPNELKDNCNKLRNNCYQKKREEVAEEALLRALSGSLKEKNSCKEKLKEVCLLLSGENDELMERCFDEEKTCQTLMTKKQDKCQFLKAEIEKLLKKDNELKTKCLPLLRECHFYGETCTINKSDCKNLLDSCRKKDVIYTEPGLDFEPIRPGITLAEEIELEELYKEAAKKGVRIGRPPTRDAAELLLLLSQSSTKPTVAEKCKEVLGKKCKDLKEHEILKDLCEKDNDKANVNGTNKCNELQEKQAKSIKNLSKKIENKHLTANDPNAIIMWNDLSTFLTEKDCRTLESDCLYLKGQDSLEKPCSNLKAACYKKGLEAVANEALQDKLRGKLHGSNGTWFENLQKSLVEVCKELKGKSDELFVLCVQPKKAALVLSTDLRFRAIFLREQLNEKRDYPTETDCKELEEKCRVLGQDSKEIKWPCFTLNQHCNRLRNAQELEEKLLVEKTKDLDNVDSCTKKLNERCDNWNTKRKTLFDLACIAQETTCQIIAKSVEFKCDTLKDHIKAMKILEGLNKENNLDKKGQVCDFWESYCDKYMSSCKNFATTAKDNECENLKKGCKLYRTQRDREDAVMLEFKGNLDNKNNCISTLDQYCTQWNQAENETLKGFCSNTSGGKSNDMVRDELCKKLVGRVQEKCRGLQDKLKKARKELEKQKQDYEKVKGEAEEAIKAANLVLSAIRTTDNKTASKAVPNVPGEKKDTKPFKLVRRNANVQVTEKEAEAFDLAAQAFSLYLELMERCRHLKGDCAFKKECKSETPCGKIDGICLKIEPLKVKPYEATTKNVTTTTTTTTTTTETVKDAKATDCQSLQTTDTWVTKTSTHTSTSTTTSTVTSRITLTSTRRCKPTKCTTGEEDEAGDVKPSEGLRVSGWNVMRGVLLAMMISFMI